MRRAAAPLCAAALVASVVAANWLTSRYGLVPAGFGLLVSAGTYAAGMALGLRDAVDRYGGLWWVLASIAAGVAVSAVVGSGRIAAASAAAFALSELADLAVWRRLRRGGAVAAPLIASNAVGAIVDTLVFLPLSGLPVVAASIAGQLIVKAVWLTAAALLVVAAVRAARPREVHA